VLEESEEELEMVSELVLEVVPEEVPVERAMIVVHAGAPSLPHGAAELSSPTHHVAAATDATASVVGEPKVVMGHPTFYVLDDIPLHEVVSTAHRALSQAQIVLRQEDKDLTDKRRRL
jgi:hypothetical protein